MTRRRPTAADTGRSARQAIDGLCSLLEACGHPDGARLRAALAACERYAPAVRDVLADDDPAAAALEGLAEHVRRARRRLPRP